MALASSRYARPSSATLLHAKMNAYQSPSRTPTFRRAILIRPEDITDAAHGMNQLFFRIDLAAHAMHEHVDDVRLRVEAVIKNVLQDHRLRHDAIGVAHEIFEQCKFAGLQFDFFAVALQ